MIDYLVEKSGLLVLNAQFAVDSSDDALYLTHGEHTAEQGISGIVSVAGLIHDAARHVGECHTVVDTHRQLRILLLKNPT